MLIFRNGKTVIIGINNRYLLREYYNDDLTCKSNEEYDIIQVLRPKYEVIYEKDKENKLYFSK